jgi:ketosteroid isomerase-like protein
MKQGYQDFAEGNIEAVLAVFDPKIVWDNCQGFPFISGHGVFTGHQEIVQNVFAKIPEYYDNFQIEVDEFIESGDRVVMVGHYTGVWKPTGKKFRANAVHVWTVKGGKSTRFFQAVDTALIVNP